MLHVLINDMGFYSNGWRQKAIEDGGEGGSDILGMEV